MEQEHKRRVRYKGTHPRNYQEKYKELQPEKYADTIEKVKSKGNTPAGMHISIMVQEILDFLQIKPGQKGLDATLGYGGHTSHMLKCLTAANEQCSTDMQKVMQAGASKEPQSGGSHMYCLDVDPIEIVKTEKRLRDQGYGSDVLTVLRMNFAQIDQVAQIVGDSDLKFDFILADLGVSSMQIDNPDRGFSFKTQGPLDLRLDPTKGVSAAQRLKEVNLEELEGMLVENADEPYADRIARAILNRRKKGPAIETTTDLKDVIEAALQFLPAEEKKEAVKKSCQRCFQALRIDVNAEFEVLYTFLEKLPHVLAPGGRAAILTFHSGEDRLVKKSFQQLYKDEIYSEICKDVIRPSAEECVRNPRARSTKMRWAIRA